MIPQTNDPELLSAILGDYQESDPLKAARNAFIHGARQATVTFGQQYINKPEFAKEQWIKAVQDYSKAHLALLELMDKIIEERNRQ